MSTQLNLRPSPIAGQWYPGNPRQLAESVDRYLESADLPPLDGQVVAVMAPHAGHRYSGPVAGYAFAALRGLQPEVVAVVSPMHQPYSQPLLTSAHDAYQTPLGTIRIDQQAVTVLDNALTTALGFGLTPVPRDPEHSLEIELPFLQRALPDEFSLIPIMVRDQSARVAQTLGSALADLLRDRNGLLVASTDLSHFYPQAVAEKLDGEILRRIAAFDPQGVLQAEEQGKGFACGRAAVAAVLWAAKGIGADSVQILNYATSGDITGDFSQVVGYAAAVITRKT
jgi:AmmeMemoRadiSam system protein B